MKCFDFFLRVVGLVSAVNQGFNVGVDIRKGIMLFLVTGSLII